MKKRFLTTGSSWREVFWQQIPHKEEVSWLQIPHGERFLTTYSSQPENCMLKKNKKKVSDLRSLTTCLSLLDMLCTLPACCLRLASLLLLSPREGVCHQIPLYGRPACWWTLQGMLPETCCFLLDFFLDLPSTCTFLPKTGHAAAALPLHFCPRPSEHRATGPLLDPAGDYPCFMQSLPLSIYSIAHLPFPITLNRPSSPSPSPLLRFVINWSDQHLDGCFLIPHWVYIFQRTSSPSYKWEWDTNFGHISLNLSFQKFFYTDLVKIASVQKDASQSGPQVTGQ